MEIEKKESKTLENFHNYSSRLARALSTIRAGRARAFGSKRKFYDETDQELDISLSGNTGTIPK